MLRFVSIIICAWVTTVTPGRTCVADDSTVEFPPEVGDQLLDVIQDGIERNSVVGAQIAIGTSDELVLSRSFGVVAPGSEQPVDRQTLFCIGSCSKPLVSALVMTLVDAGLLSLDEPISNWLAEFSGLHDRDGNAVERAPTMRELLAHRGGIYSQRNQLTPAQTRAIRDFRLTLEESVAIISRQPLIAVPGESFHYSGAGYCVLGRVAEAAAKQSIEELLQNHLCEPLELTRTTWFPAADDDNVAAGGFSSNGRVRIHPQSPHLLGAELRLPLVGGSIHSTAEETARFAMMMLNHGRCGEHEILSPRAFRELTRRQYPDGAAYGLGWSLLESDDGRIVALTHGGALFSSRSLLFVDLAHGDCVVVHWTLSDPQAGDIRGGFQKVLGIGV